MLPTPDTSHVPYSRVYEPAEDSFLLLDTLSLPSETAFLHSRWRDAAGAPLVVEIGPGSGVVVAFVTAHARHILGTAAVLSAAVDVNGFACKATRQTVGKAVAAAGASSPASHGVFLGVARGDLAAPLRRGSVDVLIFNPPYVPTEELPRRHGHDVVEGEEEEEEGPPTFSDESYLLALSYAGGADGMEVTDRLVDGLHEVLSPRGCAYILLCAQNKPEEVKERIRGFGEPWRAETVGTSGKQAGWERLQVVRVWRE